MKKEDISDALSFLDDDLIEQTNALRMKPRKCSVLKLIVASSYAKWSAVAAVFVICMFVFGEGLIPKMEAQKAAHESADYSTTDEMGFSELKTGGVVAYDIVEEKEFFESTRSPMPTEPPYDVSATCTPTAYAYMATPTCIPSTENAPVTVEAEVDGNSLPFLGLVNTKNSSLTYVQMDIAFDAAYNSGIITVSVAENAEFEFGPEWYLEYENAEGEWKLFETKEPLEWNAVIYRIGETPSAVNGDKEWSQEIDFTAYDFESLPKGTTNFRICKSGRIYGPANEPVKNVLTFEFSRQIEQ